jgi:transposase
MNLDSRLPQELWDRIPPEAQAYIQAREARSAALEATLQQVQEQLRQDSRTSSRPPSSDRPQARNQRSRHEPSGRRPGGQPGHAGQTRRLVPGEAVAAVMSVKPARCRRCQHSLHGEDPQPRRHQGTEIPPVRPMVTEYQVHRLVCPVCGEATRAELPRGVPTGEFGPRVQALAALCTGAYHLAKRTTQGVLTDLFGVQLSGGTIANLEQATVPALAEPVAEARADVQAQATAYMDETGWREGAQRAWLWTAVTAWVTVFVVRRSRGAMVAHELLGERFWGYLVTDRWSAYTW